MFIHFCFRFKGAALISLAVLLSAGILAGCGGGGGGASTPSNQPTVTASRSVNATYFQGQTIVGSANGQAVGRLMILGNFAHAPSGFINGETFGYTDANGVPTGIAEIAVWQDDPAKAVYAMYDGNGYLIKVLQLQTGNAITIAYDANDPTQFTVIFLKPDGTTAGRLAGTVDASNKVTFHAITSAVASKAASISSTNRKSRSSIDADDNPPDNDGDENVPDNSKCKDDNCLSDLLAYNQSILDGKQNKIALQSAAVASAIGAVNITTSEGLESVFALLDFKDLQKEIGAIGLAFQSLSTPPASSSISRDNAGKGLPAYQPTPNP